MALSANAKYVTRDGEPIAMKVLTSSVVYNGAYCSHDTTTGAIKPFDGTKADVGVGWHFGASVTGDTTADVPPRAAIHPGNFIIENLAVGGLSDDDTDLGAPVWATDDGTYTITDPSTTGHEVGVVVRRRGSANADVYMNNMLGHNEP